MKPALGFHTSLGRGNPCTLVLIGACAGGWWAANFVLMCTLAIYFQVTTDCPVVIAANRDEFLERPAVDPTTLLEHPHVVGGKDLRAGGTWLGISEHGIVAGLLNRRAENGANPRNSDLRERG